MRLTRHVPLLGLMLLLASLLPCLGRAGELNIAALSCDKYENEVLGPATSSETADPTKNPDSINTVMWLFGYSVAKAGDHHMYGEALATFGFALDAECKRNPSSSLLQALTAISPKRDKPMDLATLNCATFETRHAESTRSDPESATTIMMWLFGFSVGLSGSHVFDESALPRFAAALQTVCTQHPDDSLFDALTATAKPVVNHR